MENNKKKTLKDFLEKNKDFDFFNEIKKSQEEFNNDSDLFGLCVFIKKKYGFWVDAHYREDGSISIPLPLYSEIQILHD